MRRFVVTLVVAAILAVASLFPLARSAYAEPQPGTGPWRYAGASCPTRSGDVGTLYYNENSDRYQCFRD